MCRKHLILPTSALCQSPVNDSVLILNCYSRFYSAFSFLPWHSKTELSVHYVGNISSLSLSSLYYHFTITMAFTSVVSVLPLIQWLKDIHVFPRNPECPPLQDLQTSWADHAWSWEYFPQPHRPPTNSSFWFISTTSSRISKFFELYYHSCFILHLMKGRTSVSPVSRISSAIAAFLFFCQSRLCTHLCFSFLL